MKRLLALFLTLVLCAGCAPAGAEGELTLFAINVGKADCLLLTAGDAAYLIDTGTEESWGAVSAALKLLNVTQLDGVILTHTDKDHAGGAWALATSSIQVDGWYAPVYFTDVKAAKHPLVKAAAIRNEEIIWLKAGDTLPLPGGILTVLGPVTHDTEKENNNSLVLRAETADGSMLLAGDMEFPEEQSLMAQGLIKPADVLKVGNHGEADATSEAFVQLVRPQIAVISTNTADEPDTPAPRVLRALADVKVVQTQHAQAGVKITLTAGKAEAAYQEYAELPDKVRGVVISDRSVAQDFICLRNDSKAAVDISGWFLYSDKGGQTFVFPAGTVLEAGQEIGISALDSPDAGDFVWPDEEVWHPEKPDTALLYDVYGRMMDEY